MFIVVSLLYEKETSFFYSFFDFHVDGEALENRFYCSLEAEGRKMNVKPLKKQSFSFLS